MKNQKNKLNKKGMNPLELINIKGGNTQDGDDLFLRKRPGRTTHGGN